MVRFPEATKCRGSAPVLFYIRLLVAYQLPLGPWPLFGVKDTTAVAFTGLKTPGPWKEIKSLSSLLCKKKKKKYNYQEEVSPLTPPVDLCF